MTGMKPSAWQSLFTDRLAVLDPEAEVLIAAQRAQNARTVNLIASETYAPLATLEALASALVDKTAAGYPPRQDTGGIGVVNAVEHLASARARALFGAEHANIQPLSATIANVAVMRGLLQRGDRILAFDPLATGPGRQGSARAMLGRDYEAHFFGVTDDGMVDYEAASRLAFAVRPRMIVAASRAHPRALDFRRMAQIGRQTGALVFADIAHVAGLVVAGLHENPVPFCDVVTASTHKSLCGPRTGALILCRAQHAAAIDAMLATGLQMTPGAHTMAARAVQFGLVAQPAFKALMQAVLAGAAALAEGLGEAEVVLYAEGTQTHMVVVDLRATAWHAARLNAALFAAGVAATTTMLPMRGEGELGLQLGATPMAIRGLDTDGFRALGRAIGRFLATGGQDGGLAAQAAAIAAACPVPPGLSPG